MYSLFIYDCHLFPHIQKMALPALMAQCPSYYPKSYMIKDTCPRWFTMETRNFTLFNFKDNRTKLSLTQLAKENIFTMETEILHHLIVLTNRTKLSLKKMPKRIKTCMNQSSTCVLMKSSYHGFQSFAQNQFIQTLDSCQIETKLTHSGCKLPSRLNFPAHASAFRSTLY